MEVSRNSRPDSHTLTVQKDNDILDWGNINPKQGDETGRGGPNDERDDSRSPRDDSDSKTKGAVVWGSPRSEEGWNTRKLSEDPILNPEKSSSSKPCNWGMGHHTEGWGNSGVSGGWGHSGPRDKVAGVLLRVDLVESWVLLLVDDTQILITVDFLPGPERFSETLIRVIFWGNVHVRVRILVQSLPLLFKEPLS